MSSIANTPEPPYYAVIFSSINSENDQGYVEMATRMVELAQQQSGFLGMESVREGEGIGITVSYWSDIESIRQCKANVEHQQAQRLGRKQWYTSFKARIAKVERDYGL